MKWIKIETKEPPQNIDYCIVTYINYYGEKETVCAWINDDGEFEDWNDNIIENVIAWMELPPPF